MKINRETDSKRSGQIMSWGATINFVFVYMWCIKMNFRLLRRKKLRTSLYYRCLGFVIRVHPSPLDWVLMHLVVSQSPRDRAKIRHAVQSRLRGNKHICLSGNIRHDIPQLKQRNKWTTSRIWRGLLIVTTAHFRNACDVVIVTRNFTCLYLDVFDCRCLLSVRVE